jgi:hypothetical protein
MKKHIFTVAVLLVSTSLFAKIVKKEDGLYIESKESQSPIESINHLVRLGSVKKLTIYGNGNINLVSFAKGNGPLKLYSVDLKGFIYAIEPFSSYRISEVHPDGSFRFQEFPNRKYKINDQGYFLY